MPENEGKLSIVQAGERAVQIGREFGSGAVENAKPLVRVACLWETWIMPKKLVKVRCAKCGHIDDPREVELQGKSLVFVCPNCGERKTTSPDEDFSQATSRTIR